MSLSKDRILEIARENLLPGYEDDIELFARAIEAAARAELLAGVEVPEPVAFRVRYRRDPGMLQDYPWSYQDQSRRPAFGFSCETEDLYTADQLRAGIAAARAEQKWQPIETAPQNVWVLVNNGGFVDIAMLYSTGRWFNTRDFECSYVHDWMPLPPPPSADAIREGGEA